MRRLTFASALLVVFLGCGGPAQRATLDIYWIDVEGGAATLIVTPARESVLMDAGWDRDDERDAKRIEAAMVDAGITEIDYFIASHFHGDHVGGVPAIAARSPIGQYIDHGDSVEQDSERRLVAWGHVLERGRRQTPYDCARRRIIPRGARVHLRDSESGNSKARIRIRGPESELRTGIRR